MFKKLLTIALIAIPIYLLRGFIAWLIPDGQEIMLVLLLPFGLLVLYWLFQGNERVEPFSDGGYHSRSRRRSDGDYHSSSSSKERDGEMSVGEARARERFMREMDEERAENERQAREERETQRIEKYERDIEAQIETNNQYWDDVTREEQEQRYQDERDARYSSAFGDDDDY